MIPVMQLNEVQGYWESEPGNKTVAYINPMWIAFITPYYSDEGMWLIRFNFKHEGFVTTEDFVAIESPGDAVRQEMAERAWANAAETGEN